MPNNNRFNSNKLDGPLGNPLGLKPVDVTIVPPDNPILPPMEMYDSNPVNTPNYFNTEIFTPGSVETNNPTAPEPIPANSSPVLKQAHVNNAPTIKPVHINNTSTGSFDMDKFKPKIYDIETRGGTIKDRQGSNYSGIAQLGTNERTPILKKLGVTDAQYKNNIDIQKRVASEWFNGLQNRLQKGGFKVNDLNMWIAHNQGVGGLNQILHNKVSPTVLRNIRNQAGMNKNSTVQDYLSYYSNRLR